VASPTLQRRVTPGYRRRTRRRQTHRLPRPRTTRHRRRRSPWLNRGHVRLTPPDETKLRRIWETEETISGVARQLDVSVNTAAVWLAEIGVFVKETPVISQRDLLDAIDKRQSIKDICRQHHVTARTVAVELRRHGLLAAHKKRHLR
jgi:hypothetical protein